MTDQLPAEFTWEPMEFFEWTEKGEDGRSRQIGEYHPGMTYNCTRFSRHQELRAKCQTWLAAGKIRIHPLPPGKKFRMTTTLMEEKK